MATKREIVSMLLQKELKSEEEEELIDLIVNQPISVDVDKKEEQSLTFGEKLADKISEIAGSWSFILGFCLFLVFWIVLNVVLLTNKPDPYPFILLNLLLSCLAALQAPVIMMSQNRQAKKDSIRNQNDYRTDLKSELILEDLHHHIHQVISNQNKILKLLGEENENNKSNKRSNK